jgi:hypothetical protein
MGILIAPLFACAASAPHPEPPPATAVSSGAPASEAAQEPTADPLQGQPSPADSTKDGDEAKYEQARARCGETHVGTESISSFLKQSSNSPKSIKVDHCAAPVLTERCWQIQCEFQDRAASGATVKQRANFYAEGETIVAVDVL